MNTAHASRCSLNTPIQERGHAKNVLQRRMDRYRALAEETSNLTSCHPMRTAMATSPTPQILLAVADAR